MNRKRAYFVTDANDDMYGWPVIASSAKEAKKMAAGSPGLEDTHWIDMRVKWLKKADITGLQEGVCEETGEETEFIEFLKRGLYAWIEESDCPRCGQTGRVSYDSEYVEGGYYCDCCDGFEKCPKCGDYRRNEEDELCEDCKEEGEGNDMV